MSPDSKFSTTKLYLLANMGPEQRSKVQSQTLIGATLYLMQPGHQAFSEDFFMSLLKAIAFKCIHEHLFTDEEIDRLEKIAKTKTAEHGYISEEAKSLVDKFKSTTQQRNRREQLYRLYNVSARLSKDELLCILSQCDHNREAVCEAVGDVYLEVLQTKIHENLRLNGNKAPSPKPSTPRTAPSTPPTEAVSEAQQTSSVDDAITTLRNTLRDVRVKFGL